MPEESPLPELLAKHPFLRARPSSDHPAVDCPPERLPELLRALRDEAGYDLLIDLTAIDAGETASPRFTVVYHFLTSERPRYLRVAAACPDDSAPALPTASALWPGANWHEREAYDMFGITFPGHPDLKRILMWDGYPYFPLRKDFPLAGHETPLPAADVTERTGAKVLPAPLAGGPFHSEPGGSMSESEPRGRDESWNEKSPKPLA